MSKYRTGIAIAITLIAVVSLSSCVYRPYNSGYDRGYGYGYGYYPPPPRPIIVRPAPPPRVIYRDNRRMKPYNRGNSRNNGRHYGQNGRTYGPR